MNPSRGEALLSLLLLLSLAITGLCSADTEGGNLTALNVTVDATTLRWGAVVGLMNTSLSPGTSAPIGTANLSTPTVISASPNGSFFNYSMIVTRLATKPSPGNISSPNATDLDVGGIFSSFSVFDAIPYSAYADNPVATFCNPCVYTTCKVGNQTFSCPYITLNDGTRVGLLKYSNGTSVEPIFVATVYNHPGYNGSNFDFEYLLPSGEFYYFYVYDVIPPNVTIISPVGGATYGTGSAPLIFNVTDNAGVDSCWYILDSVRTDLPSCSLAYLLSVGAGQHTLTLYANDTSNNIGSATVTFYGAAPTPPVPPGPSRGGGPPGTPISQPPPPQPSPPVTPPPQPPLLFNISPENISVFVVYPNAGTAGFTLYSGTNLTNLRCYVGGDMARYSTITLGSNVIHAGETVPGTITINMTPDQMLAYPDSVSSGALQCTGDYNSSVPLEAVANLYVQFRRPGAEGMNNTASARPGEIIAADVAFRNNGNADDVNLSASVPPKFSDWMRLRLAPDRVRAGEIGRLTFAVSVPSNVPPGTYQIPVTITENGLPLAVSTLTLSVMGAPITPCVLPDLRWTILILIAGLALAAVVFRMAIREKEFHDEKIKDRDEKKREFYMRAAVLALVIAVGTIIIWAFIVWMLYRC